MVMTRVRVRIQGPRPDVDDISKVLDALERGLVDPDTGEIYRVTVSDRSAYPRRAVGEVALYVTITKEI